jgi:hypothetical protein
MIDLAHEGHLGIVKDQTIASILAMVPGHRCFGRKKNKIMSCMSSNNSSGSFRMSELPKAPWSHLAQRLRIGRDRCIFALSVLRDHLFRKTFTNTEAF